jgi:hypothetical protein
LIDYVRLLRYARRRGKAEEVKKYIGEYAGDYILKGVYKN